jgi:hypothetical protein
MKKLVFLIISLLFFFSAIVYADCVYNGVSYPEGTMINGLTCQADGNWGI